MKEKSLYVRALCLLYGYAKVRVFMRGVFTGTVASTVVSVPLCRGDVLCVAENEFYFSDLWETLEGRAELVSTHPVEPERRESLIAAQ